MNTPTSSQQKRLPVSEVSDTLEKAVAQFDDARATDLDEMSQVRAAKFNGLTRDRARLAAKLGDDDPRVVALDRSIAFHAETLPGFRAEIAAASVDPPRVDAKSWTLQGNVLDAGRLPVTGVTLALYQKDVWVRALGYACTDDNGYFVLPVAEASRTDLGPLSLRVLRSGDIIFADPRPVTLQPGHVEYREIILGPASDVCPPPVNPDTPGPPVTSTPRPTPTKRATPKK